MKFTHFFNCDALPELGTPQLLEDIERLAIAADRLGYDAIYLAEHHFTEYGRMPAPLTFLARLSALTERIDLGTAVIEAPYYHPLRLAEEVALLDRLSGGRLRLGVGSGAANKPLEFERFGVTIEEKGSRTLEVLEIVRRALSEGAVEFSGDYYRFARSEFAIRPVRPVDQLLWLAASRRTVDYAAAHGLPVMLPRPVEEAGNRDLVRSYRAGLPPGAPGHVASLRFIFVGETETEARDIAHATFTRYANYDAGTDWDGRWHGSEFEAIAAKLKFVAGTPDQVEQQLRVWIADLGVDEIITQMYAAGTRFEDALRSLELFSREVMPRFEAAPFR